MNVYAHLNYQSALEEIVENRRNSANRVTLRKMAEAVGLQPSFLTNVLKRRFEFNADQLYAVTDYLGLSPQERRYLLLLLDYQRSSHRQRKQELKQEIDEVRKQYQKTEKHISAKPMELSSDAQAEYYLDPFVQLAHVHLNLAPYSSEPEKLCAALGVSKSHLAQILSVLMRVGYIQQEAGRYRVVARNKHLPKEAPLCGPHQALMRLKSIDQMQRLTSDEKYSFSATITGTDETRAELQEAFMTFLKKAESIVKAAESKKVFQMNFDMFPWEI